MSDCASRVLKAGKDASAVVSELNAETTVLASSRRGGGAVNAPAVSISLSYWPSSDFGSSAKSHLDLV